MSTPPRDAAGPVEPEVVAARRPWPWAGKTTPPLIKFKGPERALMTFFYIVSVLMVLAIIVVALLTFTMHQPTSPAP